jgi:hypothetical protein
MENPPALTAQLFSSLKRRGIEEAAGSGGLAGVA